MSEIRVGVVGLGGISMEHFEKLARIPEARVVGICDLSETLVAAVEERFGVGPGFTSYERMLDEARPHVVHVLTPPQTHGGLVLGALDAGAHVLVEKPIAPTWAEYVQMRDAARDRGLLLIENLNYRFMRAFVRALELQAAGAIGDLVAADVTIGAGIDSGPYADPDVTHFGHALPGGALRNVASHPASIVVALLGAHNDIAVSLRRLGAEARSFDELRALIGFEQGVATLTMTSHSRPVPGLSVLLRGTAGTLDVDLLDRRLHLDSTGSPLARITNPARHGGGYLTSTAALLARALTSSHDLFEGFERLLRGFYAAVAGNGPAPLTIEEMDAVNALVEALFAEGNRL